MKLSRIPRSVLKLSAAALVLTLGFTACDDDDLDPIEKDARIGVLNLLEDVDAVNAHVGNKKINSAAIQAGTFSPYYAVDAGQNRLSIFAAGETDTLARVNHNFKADESFSAIILGTEDDAEVVVLSDDLKAPASGKAKIRFVNLAEDTEGLELWLGTGTSALVSDVDYKATKAFVEVNPAATIAIQVRESGDDEAYATLANAKLEAGKVYTAYVFIDEVAGVDTPTLRLITNK